MSAMDAHTLAHWLHVLDDLSYYDLFRVAPAASFDEVRLGFHVFCETFHPDAHMSRPPGEREAVSRIFKRGTEAYRILSEPQLRSLYDQAIAQGGRPADIVVSMKSAQGQDSTGNKGPVSLSDKIKNAAARPFVRRAEELFKKGDTAQAKIQLVLAMHLEPNNAALIEFQGQLQGAKKA